MLYNFFCIICGKDFTSNRNHSITCSTKCRVVLSKVRRVTIVPDDQELLDPTEKKQVSKLYKKVVLGQWGEKKNEEISPKN